VPPPAPLHADFGVVLETHVETATPTASSMFLSVRLTSTPPTSPPAESSVSCSPRELRAACAGGACSATHVTPLLSFASLVRFDWMLAELVHGFHFSFFLFFDALSRNPMNDTYTNLQVLQPLLYSLVGRTPCGFRLCADHVTSRHTRDCARSLATLAFPCDILIVTLTVCRLIHFLVPTSCSRRASSTSLFQRLARDVLRVARSLAGSFRDQRCDFARNAC
jgi:hypothetical protein